MKKFVIDLIDYGIINGKSNMLKLLGFFLLCILVKYFIDVVVKVVINEVKKLVVCVGVLIFNEVFFCGVKNFCKYVSKKMGFD